MNSAGGALGGGSFLNVVSGLLNNSGTLAVDGASTISLPAAGVFKSIENVSFDSSSLAVNGGSVEMTNLNLQQGSSFVLDKGGSGVIEETFSLSGSSLFLTMKDIPIRK